MDHTSPERLWYQKAVILCIAMLVSTGILAAVIEVIKMQMVTAGKLAVPADVLRIVNYVLYALACSEVFAIQILRMHWRPKQQDGPLQKAQHLFRLSVITAVLAESIVIYGVVLAVVAQLYRDFYIFVGISLLLQVYYFPRWSQWQEAIQPEI